MDVLPEVRISLPICRFCLRCSTEDLVNVCDDVELVFKILACLSLEIDPEDGLPGTVCAGCLKLVEKLARFRDQCSKAELLLRASKHCRLPLLKNFERVEVDGGETPRPVGIDVGVQVEELVTSDAGNVDDVVLPVPSKQELDDEGWHMADEADDEVLIDLTRNFYGEDREDSRPDGEQSGVPVGEDCKDCKKSSSSSDSSDSETDSSDLDTCSFVSNNDDLRQRMEEMLLAGDSQGIQPLTDDDTRDLVTVSPPIKTYDLTSSPEPDHPTEADSSRPKTPQPSFPEAMSRLFSDSLEEPKSSSKHNWSMILNRGKPPQTPLHEDPLESHLQQIVGIPETPASPDPETPASPDLDTVFGECDPIPDDSTDHLDLVNIYDGCEPISDENQRQPVTPRKPIVHPDPVSPGEIFDCELCDNFYPRQSLLEAHYKTYHTSPQHRADGKMSIVIDNPTRKCPKCGELVHKASFWAHKKSHGMTSERQLENYERGEVRI